MSGKIKGTNGIIKLIIKALRNPQTSKAQRTSVYLDSNNMNHSRIYISPSELIIDCLMYLGITSSTGFYLDAS